MHQGIRGAQIDADITGEEAEQRGYPSLTVGDVKKI
jgi:hypothetical protein